jgi:hypothetical protein
MTATLQNCVRKIASKYCCHPSAALLRLRDLLFPSLRTSDTSDSNEWFLQLSSLAGRFLGFGASAPTLHTAYKWGYSPEESVLTKIHATDA